MCLAPPVPGAKGTSSRLRSSAECSHSVCTLEEVLDANLILHVRDISHPETDAQANDVNDILEELDVSDNTKSSILEVWNKTDYYQMMTCKCKEYIRQIRKNKNSFGINWGWIKRTFIRN